MLRITCNEISGMDPIQAYSRRATLFVRLGLMPAGHRAAAILL